MVESGRKLSSFMSLFLMQLSWMDATAFNIDTEFPVTFNGPERSYFGYTVAMNFDKTVYTVLVGAPTANSTIDTEVYEPGVFFSCDINSTLCEEVNLVSRAYTSYWSSVKEKLSYRMWLGSALAVRSNFNQSFSNNDVVVCGHRHIRGTTSVNGICFVLEHDLNPNTVRGLKPLDNYDKQYVFDSEEYVYRSFFNNGQVGISATYSEDGSHLAVGAPGIFEGTGSVFYYNGITDVQEVQSKGLGVKEISSGREKHAYFGYSITSGHFFNLTVDQFAVGAPRGENHGKVFVISLSDSQWYSVLESKKGSELGEYFGASVLGTNLNGDSFTDLIVGAPLYATDTGCDEGKVTVYISDGSQLNFHTHLYGDGKSDARFGNSLAAIDDINNDGFKDFAVGAPYEDGKGAVYIYHGSDSGIIAQYSQKIEAIQMNPNLAGFGIQISEGLDIDDNGYPDIIVGSYLSSHAVLLRSRPVIQVSLEVSFNPSKIEMTKANCVYQGKSLPCVHVDACLTYAGKHVPTSLDFQCTLLEQDANPRGFFYPYRPKNAAAEKNVTVKVDIETCFSLQFYLLSDIKDIISPIPIQFSCELAPSTSASNSTFESTYPVVSPSSNKNITKEIPFHSGCADDNICNSDLIVEAELLGEAKDGSITLGNVSSVSIDITVRNEGEPAYSSELLIFLPPEVPIINKDFCVTKRQPHQEVIACDLGNPLVKDRQVNIRIKLDVMKIEPHTKIIEIFLESATNSSETNLIDNILTISLEVKTISDIGIRGTPSHYLILYHEDQKRSSTINHRFTVMNYGPSPLQTIDILLEVPQAILSSEGWQHFLYFREIKTDGVSDNILPAVCDDTLVEYENFLQPEPALREINGENEKMYSNESSSSSMIDNRLMKRSIHQTIPNEGSFSSQSDIEDNNVDSSGERRNFLISCDNENFQCAKIHCSASTFSDVRKFAEISVAFKIDYTVLNKHFDPWNQIEFQTKGFISVSDSAVILLPHHSEVTLVKTVLHHGGGSSKEIPHWLFSVGAIIGSMLLFQIVIILIKVGFFRRKEKEILERLEQSFSASNTEEVLLIDPSEGSSSEGE